MDWKRMFEVAIPVLAVVGGLLKLWEVRGAKAARLMELKAFLDIAKELPEKGSARATAFAYVESRVERFIKDEKTKSRDPVGMTVAVLFLAGGGWSCYAAATGGAWYWWALAGFLLLFGAVGFAQDGVRRERDSKGRPLRHDALLKSTRGGKPAKDPS